VAKKPPSPSADALDDAKRVQVNIDGDLARKARLIAAAMGLSLPDYVNNKLRPIIDEELPAILEQMGYERKQPTKK
jgi:predicted HicB family RNase H-like nuclease